MITSSLGYKIPVARRLAAAESYLMGREANLDEARRALQLPVTNGLIRIPHDREAWPRLYGRRFPAVDLEAQIASYEASVAEAKSAVERFRAEAEGVAA